MISNAWFPTDYEEYKIFAVIIFIIFSLIVSNYAHRKGLLSPEENRRLIHTTIGIIMSFSTIIFSSKFFPSFLAIAFVFFNIIAFKSKVLSGIHSQKRKSYGTIYFPLSYFIVSYLFWEKNQFAILCLLILAISDPIAAQIGSMKSSTWKFKVWHDYKTINGTIAFFISSILILVIGNVFILKYNLIDSISFILITAIFATISEITSKRGTDNISIPIISILFMVGLNDQLSIHQDIINKLYIPFKLIFITCILFIPYRMKILSMSGYFGSITMGALFVLFGNIVQFILIALFFVLSSSLNLIIKKYTERKSKNSRRNIVQVVCNGGVAIIICIYDYFNPNPVNIYLYAATVAAATSDTWATEFGKLSESKPISVTSFRPIEHGLSGGITMIGIFGSILGASIIGLAAYLLVNAELKFIFGVIFTGFLSALLDSLIGDTLQGKYETKSGEIIENMQSDTTLISGYKIVDNNLVNLIATLAGPFLMYIFIYFAT
tara:strand:+ start:27 stop:1505 length:1479 start_codon:yes stop_codon:yes gene_type:complete